MIDHVTSRVFMVLNKLYVLSPSTEDLASTIKLSNYKIYFILKSVGDININIIFIIIILIKVKLVLAVMFFCGREREYKFMGLFTPITYSSI